MDTEKELRNNFLEKLKQLHVVHNICNYFLLFLTNKNVFLKAETAENTGVALYKAEEQNSKDNNG